MSLFGIEKYDGPLWRSADYYPSMVGVAAGGTTYDQLRMQMRNAASVEKLQRVGRMAFGGYSFDGPRIDDAGWPKRDAANSEGST